MRRLVDRMEIDDSGKIALAAAPSAAMAFITDVDSVIACIPEVVASRRIDDRNFNLTVKVGLSLISGDFDMKCTVADKGKNYAVYKISGGGMGSTVNILLSLSVKARGKSKSELEWRYESSFGGIVSGVGDSIIRKVTEDYIGRIVKNLKKALEKKKQK